MEDPFDEEDTKECVRGILMEELSSQSDVDGVVFCDSLFALLDGINPTIDNPIANPPTNTKIRLTSNTNTNTNTKTHSTKRLTSPCHLEQQHKQEEVKITRTRRRKSR